MIKFQYRTPAIFIVKLTAYRNQREDGDMITFFTHSWPPKFAFSLFLGWLLLYGTPQEAVAFPVSINTAALNGTAARLDFILFDGDLAANNSATISGLITNGTLQGHDCTLSCTGGPPFIISDTGGFGEFSQDLIWGT